MLRVQRLHHGLQGLGELFELHRCQAVEHELMCCGEMIGRREHELPSALRGEREQNAAPIFFTILTLE